MGYLFDVILTRDPFLHRVDIALATETPMVATAEHEGVIVDDVVTEWASRHGAAYDLELTGPAGGHWRHGDGEHDHHGCPRVLPRTQRSSTRRGIAAHPSAILRGDFHPTERARTA